MSAKLLSLGSLALLFGCTTISDFEPDSATIDTSPWVDTGEWDSIEPALCHGADPLDVTEVATRTYSINREGRTGTEVQTILGLGQTPEGVDAYLVESQISAEGAELLVTSYRECNGSGGAGLLEERTTGDVPFEFGGVGIPGMDLPVDIRRMHSEPEPYLADVATLRGSGSWSYAYELMLTATQDSTSMFNLPNCSTPDNPEPDQNNANCLPVEGSVDAFGVEEITVNGQTYEAFRLIDRKLEKWSESGGLDGGFDISDMFDMIMPGFGSSDVEIISQRYYVEGLGLVKEQTYEVNPGGTPNMDDPVMVRELTAHTMP